MKKILIYDSHCLQCNALAKYFESLTKAQYELISIHSNDGKTLLEQAQPNGWSYRPHLLFVGEDSVKAVTGLVMGLYMLKILGIKGVASLLTQSYKTTNQSPSMVSHSRRGFLTKAMFAFTTALAVGLLKDQKGAQAQCPCYPQQCYYGNFCSSGVACGCLPARVYFEECRGIYCGNICSQGITAIHCCGCVIA